jgi:7-cyano-7-deazaguanosine (preQ0) biosynthesis protein QueE
VPAEDELVVSEVFGPTFQGEGPSLGRRAAFVRLGRCNLACRWCDTPYTWRWEDHDPAVELHTMTVDEVASRVCSMGAPLLVVTGGEPLLQQRRLPRLLEVARRAGMSVEIETAGTIAPSMALTALVDRFNVSPKLASSGNRPELALRHDALAAFEATGKAAFKFVVTDVAELDEVAAIVERDRLSDIWVMPEGTDADTVVRRHRALADAVIKRGWQMTTRLHVLIWGDTRGV